MNFLTPVVIVHLLAACALLQGIQGAAVIDATKELILTPFIKNGELDKARATSEDNMDLSKMKTSNPVKSYSGYFTVDEKANSNLFFWFFPAQETPEKAPVILYVNESPGLSCLPAIFIENGPFTITENNELANSNSSWTKFASMLYIDAPVGSGFSFSERDEGLAKTSEDEAQEVYSALVQFFTVFKEFTPLEFYLAGVGYAGTFIPHIANKIEKENAKAEVKINLKGFLVESPFLDVTQQGDKFSEFYYNLGLIDEAQRDEIAALRETFKGAVEKGDQLTALSIISELYDAKNSKMSKFSGFSDLSNALETKRPEQYERFEKFIATKEVQNYLHVGLHQFVEKNLKTFTLFFRDFITPHTIPLQELLDKDYKILIISSQFNLAIPPPGVMALVRSLRWKGAEEFLKAPRKIWKVKDDIAGYAKESGNFAFVMMRNAGGHAFHDQPDWTLDLVQRYLKGTGFD